MKDDYTTRFQYLAYILWLGECTFSWWWKLRLLTLSSALWSPCCREIITLPILSTSLIHVFLNGWENVHFELGSESCGYPPLSSALWSLCCRSLLGWVCCSLLLTWWTCSSAVFPPEAGSSWANRRTRNHRNPRKGSRLGRLSWAGLGTRNNGQKTFWGGGEGPCSIAGHVPTLPWVRSWVWVRVGLGSGLATGEGWVGMWRITRLDPRVLLIDWEDQSSFAWKRLKSTGENDDVGRGEAGFFVCAGRGMAVFGIGFWSRLKVLLPGCYAQIKAWGRESDSGNDAWGSEPACGPEVK